MKGFNKISILFIDKIVFVLLILFISSCSKWIVPEKIAGNWKGEEIVTVRVRIDGEFIFISSKDSIDINLMINPDNVVTGNIGNAILTDAIMDKNRGDLGRKLNLKTDYIITGNLSGEIFEGDTILIKPFSMPFNIEQNCFEGSIFQHTGKMGLYPMFNLVICKTD